VGYVSIGSHVVLKCLGGAAVTLDSENLMWPHWLSFGALNVKMDYLNPLEASAK